MLGFRTSCSQMVLMYLSRKPSRKVRAIEVPFGGPRLESSSSTLKAAIHVKSLLSDLSNTISRQLLLAEYDPARPQGGSWFYVFLLSKWSGFGVFVCCLELELELIQSHMAQKPVLRGEVPRVRCAIRCFATAPGPVIIGGGRQFF